MRLPAAHRPAAPRPLLVVAALLAALGLLTMHSVVMPAAAVGAAAAPADLHGQHDHAHVDATGVPHSHPSAGATASPTGGADHGSTGQPCGTCPGCDHTGAVACAIASPTKSSAQHQALSVTDLAPAPHQLTGWPTAGSHGLPAEPAPPCLIALSISRT